jgi:molecular chaperone GrpE
VSTGHEPVDEVPQEAVEPSAAPANPSPEEQQAQPDAVAELERRLAERTLDLQRLQAEYVNYKRRVDRDRDMVRETAQATALTAMVPVLDDIERARTHGELSGGFKAVAESLQRVLTGLGLTRYGDPGDPFDPRIHEALTHAYDGGVDRPTAQLIMQPGYRIGERIVRPAMVGVVEPPVDSEPVVQTGPGDVGDGAGVDTGGVPGDTSTGTGADASDSVEDPADQPAE